MNSFIHADIFFFVSSVGFVILAGLLIVALVYIIGILRRIRAISDTVGESAEGITNDAKAFVHDLRQSAVYRMLFRHKKSKKD